MDLSPRTALRDLADRFPEAMDILASYGVEDPDPDTVLAEVCAAWGVEYDMLVEDLLRQWASLQVADAVAEDAPT